MFSSIFEFGFAKKVETIDCRHVLASSEVDVVLSKLLLSHFTKDEKSTLCAHKVLTDNPQAAHLHRLSHDLVSGQSRTRFLEGIWFVYALNADSLVIEELIKTTIRTHSKLLAQGAPKTDGLVLLEISNAAFPEVQADINGVAYLKANLTHSDFGMMAASITLQLSQYLWRCNNLMLTRGIAYYFESKFEPRHASIHSVNCAHDWLLHNKVSVPLVKKVLTNGYSETALLPYEVGNDELKAAYNTTYLLVNLLISIKGVAFLSKLVSVFDVVENKEGPKVFNHFLGDRQDLEGLFS